MLKSAVRRSACDQCRAKRVRCLRAEDSMVPCARCCHIGARCETGASGHPGRPPKKQRLADHSNPRSTMTSPADVCSLGSLNRMSTPQAITRVDGHAHATAVVPPPAESSKAAAPDLWIAPDDISAFFGSPSIDESPALAGETFSPTDRSSSRSQPQGFLEIDDELNAMLHAGEHSSTAHNMYIDPLYSHHEDFTLSLTSLPQCSSVASSLVRFREEIDQRIATVDAYHSDSYKILQDCSEGCAGQDVENPAALLLTCSKDLIDIIESLTPVAQSHTQTEDALSTEIVLLALSSYLAFMRLFDSLFHRIYKHLCQLPWESYKSMKVKSVLRIGGVSALQDMPLKAYAMGVVDAIQGQVQTLERCLGIPAEYCLSGEVATLPTVAASGIFSRADRARLFWTVMAQEDIKSRRGSNSYVESIRANLKESVAFLVD